MPLALIVHGGAWDIPDDEVAEHQAGCRAALDAGWRVLEQGGSALEAVEAAVRALEDTPIFDAGVGSVLNHDGDVELDAAVMNGETLRSGAVAAVRRIRHPITLARRVLESATRTGARALGFDRFGTIEKGQNAALIAVQLPGRLTDVEEYLISGIGPELIRWITPLHPRTIAPSHVAPLHHRAVANE